MKFFSKEKLATLGAFVFDWTVRLLRPVPDSVRYRIGAVLGFLFGYAARRMRAALKDNLRQILGVEEPQLARLTNSVFKNFALTLHDFFFATRVSILVPDREKLDSLRRQKKGVLMLTFHMGNWELGARTMQQWGWPVTAVYQPYRNKRFKKLIEGNRAPGVKFIPVGGKAANGVREALRQGDMVAMLGDHPFGEDGAQVSLLGHKVMWPKGPVLLAVREKCPIVVAVVLRTGPRQYTAHIEDPLYPESGTREEVQRLVQEVAAKFGHFVRQTPSQWYRFRRFEFVK